ncbi:MAG: retroviral-like aspartic protease family protein [Caldilineaceae bacterium]
MVYTYDYDLGYLPAMPLVTIQIGKPDAGPALTLSALVDSGADATMIPANYLKAVNAVKRQYVFIRNVNGKRTGANLYTISLQFAHYKRNRIEVLGNRDTDEIIIGRDILNHLVVTLDGLANAVIVQA